MVQRLGVALMFVGLGTTAFLMLLLYIGIHEGHEDLGWAGLLFFVLTCVPAAIGYLSAYVCGCFEKEYQDKLRATDQHRREAFIREKIEGNLFRRK